MSKSSAPHRTTWSAEEIGFLAGGPGRAAEAVLARLLDGGLVRVSREGLVTAVHQNGYGARSALEAYVLAGLQGNARPINQVVQVAMASHEMGSLQEGLVARGMVHRGFGRPRGGRAALRLVLFLPAFVSMFVAVVVLEPWLFLLTALLVLAVVLLRKPGRLTRNGKTVLVYALRNPHSSADSVALYGLRRGKQRSTSSTSYVAASSCSSYDWNHHSCGGTSSCSSSSSSGCSSSSSSCSSSSSSSCSSSSSSSCSSSSSS
ncbi:TIGR04222 domain-containing membrane protein [Lentzea californiensis]|uniref:TIGR04222 domain-containing membrane protein n=1 Tax=Lentzea californiensis TaxID=438851 RepID=UPI00216513BC|nr:TIGR04222 domain-containing membrane protein [Lentzea californiensis]MCR3753610.1 TIGR04222 domain-containing protein [Lentzea californiensis]